MFVGKKSLPAGVVWGCGGGGVGYGGGVFGVVGGGGTAVVECIDENDIER